MSNPSPLHEPLLSEVRRLVAQNLPVLAIREIRRQHHVTLAEAVKLFQQVTGQPFGTRLVSKPAEVCGVALDDPTLGPVVARLIEEDDAGAVSELAASHQLSAVEAEQVVHALLAEGRPTAYFIVADKLGWVSGDGLGQPPTPEARVVGTGATGRVLVLDRPGKAQETWLPVADLAAVLDVLDQDRTSPDQSYSEILGGLRSALRADPGPTYGVSISGGVTLTMPSRRRPSGVRSVGLDEIDEVFGALDEERRQTGEDLEDHAETLAWMRMKLARLDAFESAFLAVNELCPPSDWLRDLKAATHDPDALTALRDRARAERAAQDHAVGQQVALPFAAGLDLFTIPESVRREGVTGYEVELRIPPGGFTIPSAPAQPKVEVFDDAQPDWLPKGWTLDVRSRRYTGPGGEYVFMSESQHVVAWGSRHADIEAWTEWTERDKRVLVLALAHPDRVLNPPTFAGLAQLKADGFLQELNRLVLHPAGRALGFTLDDTGRVLDVWVNPTSDPAGWGFVPAKDDAEFQANAANVAREIEALRQARLADPDLGSVVERVPGGGPCWETVVQLRDSEAAIHDRAESCLLSDRDVDADAREVAQHDAAMYILRGVGDGPDPRVTMRGDIEQGQMAIVGLMELLGQRVVADGERSVAQMSACAYLSQAIERNPAALNFLEEGWTWVSADGTPRSYTATVQRVEGRTPGQMVTELKAEVARLEEENRAIRECIALSPLYTCADCGAGMVVTDLHDVSACAACGSSAGYVTHQQEHAVRLVADLRTRVQQLQADAAQRDQRPPRDAQP